MKFAGKLKQIWTAVLFTVLALPQVAFAQNPAINWSYGEDMTAGQLVLNYSVNQFQPVTMWCHRNTSEIELVLLVFAPNHRPGDPVRTQVILGQKPYQIDSRHSSAKNGLMEIKLYFPTNSDFMPNVLASVQMQFGVPGQQYQVAYFPQGAQDKSLFSKFHGTCAWMQGEYQKQQNAGLAPAPHPAAPSTNGTPMQWAHTPGSGDHFLVAAANDGSAAVQFFCYASQPGQIGARIGGDSMHLGAGMHEITLAGGLASYTRLASHENIGQTNQDFYFTAPSSNGVWANFTNGSPVVVQAGGRTIAVLRDHDPSIVRRFLADCGGNVDTIILNASGSVGLMAAVPQQSVRPSPSTPASPNLQLPAATLARPGTPALQVQPQFDRVLNVNVVPYVCTNGAQFGVRYRNTEQTSTATLMAVNTPEVTLSSVRSGSGALYSNGQISWHTKGPDGILTQLGQELVCENR